MYKVFSSTLKNSRAFHKNSLLHCPQGTDSKLILGTVKFFNAEKGYGFISMEDGKDIFFHITSFSQTSIRIVHQGEIVEFEVGKGKMGPIAKNLVLLMEKQPSDQ